MGSDCRRSKLDTYVIYFEVNCSPVKKTEVMENGSKPIECYTLDLAQFRHPGYHRHRVQSRPHNKSHARL
jgi:hypothetical protein